MTFNDTFLKACMGRPVDYTPVWLMRQAGRYLPQYQRVRTNLSFLELCKNPELCVEVTLQPIDYLGVDAAILFSDILIPLEAMGLALEFHEGRGPVLPEPIHEKAALDRLIVPDPRETMGFVLKTIELLRRELSVPLIGFAGAPFTCATYSIEGGSSKVFWETKKMMFAAPELFHAIMAKITQTTISYLRAQAEAGAQALQLFDSWAGILAPGDYRHYALPYVEQIFTQLRDCAVPLIYFINNGATLLNQCESIAAQVIGVDWRVNIGEAARLVSPKVVQGNLDPAALLLPEPQLRTRLEALLADAEQATGHIFNLGHGVNHFTPPEKAKLVVDLVHQLSAQPDHH
jgi:uroporphyrinogen decarboxylase